MVFGVVVLVAVLVVITYILDKIWLIISDITFCCCFCSVVSVVVVVDDEDDVFVFIVVFRNFPIKFFQNQVSKR